MARHRTPIQINAMMAMEGDRAAAAQTLADFCATVNIHLEAYQPGERLGPVELDPTLAHHLALAFQRILSGEPADKALGLAFSRGRQQNRDTDRLAVRDVEIEAVYWYLAARGTPSAKEIAAGIVGLTPRQLLRKVSGPTVSEARFLATLAEGPIRERLERLLELTGRYRTELARAVRR